MSRWELSVLAVMTLILPVGVLAGTGEESVRAGNEAYAKEQYNEALTQYQIGETEKPESPELDYNIANLMHHMGKYEEAVERYNGALNSEDASLHTRVQYNLGNTYYRMGDYQNAIMSYQKVLEADPADRDAKFNLELARKMLKENMKPEQQEQQEDQQQQQDQEQQQQQQDEQQDQQQQQQDQQQENDQEQQQQDQQDQQPQEPKEISQEDAERILNALKDDEEDVQKKIRRQLVGGDYTGNDW